MIATSPALQRFGLIVDGLCAALGGRAALAPGWKPASGPVLLLAWAWLRRGAARVALWAVRMEAGILPRGRPPSPRPSPGRTGSRAASPTAPVAPVGSVAPAVRLPRGLGWLLRVSPAAGPFGSQLQHLLADPEMQALVEASPPVARVLRSMGRALGIDPRCLPPPPPRATRAEVAVPDAPVASDPAPPPLPTSIRCAAGARNGERRVSVLGYVAGRRRRPPPLGGGATSDGPGRDASAAIVPT